MFIPGKTALDIPEHRLLDILYVQFHIPGRRHATHPQPANLDLCSPEVDQQTSLKPGSPHVVEALGHIHIAKRMDGFHLHQKASFYEEIGFVISDIDAVVENLDALLLNNLDLGFPQFVGKGVLVDFLHKTRAQFVGYPKTAADDEFGEWILDGHGVLPRSEVPAKPKKVQPGMNGDERG